MAFHGLLDGIVPFAGGPIVDPERGANADLPPVIGVESWIADWALRNGCSAQATAQPLIGEVEPVFWTGCAAPVVLYRIKNGGHTWPGSPNDDPAMTNHDISANDMIWDFVSQFTLPNP